MRGYILGLGVLAALAAGGCPTPMMEGADVNDGASNTASNLAFSDSSADATDDSSNDDSTSTTADDSLDGSTNGGQGATTSDDASDSSDPGPAGGIGTTGTGVNDATDPQDDDSSAQEGSDDADRVFELVNKERTDRGLTALKRSATLDDAAQGHADDMRAESFFSHTGSNGSSVGARVTAAGYTWSRVGENIASGQRTPESVMDAWMNSDGHRANILNPNFEEIGIGIEDNGGILWVQVFGTPR